MAYDHRPTALITGASGGIGLEFARVFAQHGYDLVLVARSEGKLAELAHVLSAQHRVEARVVSKDLADGAAPRELFDQLQRESIAVDVLVNNAGFATYGPFVELDRDRELSMIAVNVVALTDLTRLFLPGMVQRRRGKVLNVASTAAFQPGPLMAVYYATKAYVLHFSEAIAEELRGTGVTVTALCPGPTASGFQERAAMEDSRLVQNGLMDAATVARLGYAGLMAGKPLVIPGMHNWLGAQGYRFMPRRLVPRIVRMLQDRTSSHVHQ